MKEEYIALSIAGAVGLFFSGVVLGLMLRGPAEAGEVLLFLMLLVVVRADAREGIQGGTYNRGWFVWRRKS